MTIAVFQLQAFANKPVDRQHLLIFFGQILGFELGQQTAVAVVGRIGIKCQIDLATGNVDTTQRQCLVSG